MIGMTSAMRDKIFRLSISSLTANVLGFFVIFTSPIKRVSEKIACVKHGFVIFTLIQLVDMVALLWNNGEHRGNDNNHDRAGKSRIRRTNPCHRRVKYYMIIVFLQQIINIIVCRPEWYRPTDFYSCIAGNLDNILRLCKDRLYDNIKKVSELRDTLSKPVLAESVKAVLANAENMVKCMPDISSTSSTSSFLDQIRDGNFQFKFQIDSIPEGSKEGSEKGMDTQIALLAKEMNKAYSFAKESVKKADKGQEVVISLNSIVCSLDVCTDLLNYLKGIKQITEDLNAYGKFPMSTSKLLYCLFYISALLDKLRLAKHTHRDIKQCASELTDRLPLYGQAKTQILENETVDLVTNFSKTVKEIMGKIESAVKEIAKSRFESKRFYEKWFNEPEKIEVKKDWLDDCLKAFKILETSVQELKTNSDRVLKGVETVDTFNSQIDKEVRNKLAQMTVEAVEVYKRMKEERIAKLTTHELLLMFHEKVCAEVRKLAFYPKSFNLDLTGILYQYFENAQATTHEPLQRLHKKARVMDMVLDHESLRPGCSALLDYCFKNINGYLLAISFVNVCVDVFFLLEFVPIVQDEQSDSNDRSSSSSQASTNSPVSSTTSNTHSNSSRISGSQDVTSSSDAYYS